MKKFYNNAIKHFQNRRNSGLNRNCSTGQVMILTTVIIGGLILSASVVAGFLMFYQLQQMNDAVASGMAVFATDAGVEHALYCYFKEPNPNNLEMSVLCKPVGSLLNLASYESSLYCVGLDKKMKESCLAPSDIDNDKVYGFRVFATGTAQRAERVLETFFSTKVN